MTFREISAVLRCAFTPHLHHGDEFRAAIEEKMAAGDKLLLVGATITAAIDGHNDVHRSVVEATRRAGEFH
jgi:hypothetical protein